jgi:two-component sensor histidine kinase
VSGSLLRYVRAPARIIFALALTIILGGLATWTWSEFAVFRSDAETIVSATALTMDDIARNSLDRVDGVLETVVGRIEEKGFDNINSEAERAALRRLTRPLPETGTIVLSNTGGNIVAAVPPLQSPLDVSEREWFRSLKAGGAEPHVSGARDATPEAPFFPLARSIRGPDNAFLGAVQAGIARSHFANIFQSLDSVFRTLDVEPDEKLGIYRTTDGAVVATFPVADARPDETVAALPYFASLANSEGESWMGWTRIGGKNHLVAARRMRRWPLIVSVSLPERTVYSGAWNRLLWRSMITFVAIAALSMLTLLSGRQARREAALMGELEHRVKNTLTVVATVIERAHDNTQSIEEFVESLRGRIQSMASTQTLLSQGHWRGVGLANLIGAELHPYATATNTILEGPAVSLTQTASYALAMVLHELSTNAAKYGALSQPGGRVSVQWTLVAEHTPGATLRIEWQETGGPEVVVPVRQGYGTSVIRNLLVYELGGKVDLVFSPGGVCCTIQLPATGKTMAA